MTNVKTPHKHAEVIRAWADGHSVQYRVGDSVEWETIGDYPMFVEDYQYRVKPEPKKHKYRVALFSRGDSVWTATEELSDEDFSEGCKNFIRYPTDWIEVEV